MLDFGAVSLEWGTLIIQLIFFLLPTILVIMAIRKVTNQSKVRQHAIEALEKRVEALEQELRSKKP
ncbi:hypothetical protein P9G84_19170 [Brevibacillus centrosporus]|uniref:hypothetical protein n=1 Tax=Brevibacillus centrosporus TaxID=54910 RepID=UPI000F09CECD|nr:hypothetical protein [Brevibacillus centrosporus]MEC2131048.1 hypothetical protein [Brevibacillus centrosporus]RNB72906.1 hypothetical protein EDM55_03430 [Brevibacillus centrosporus]GED32341.1 hypothetical protein BCE02nite_34820 [Brevibacillus centrosporus]